MAERKAATAPKEPVFSKAQLVNSKRFQHRRDVLNVVLDDDTRYTIKQAQTAIDGFLNRKEQVK